MKLFAPSATDFYKTGHYRQYPEGTRYVFSNMTPRSLNHANGIASDGKVVVAGIQGELTWFLRDLWNDTFFRQPKKQVLDKYKRRMDTSLGEGVVGIDHLAELHDLGYIPLHIKALPEGSRVDIKVPFLTSVNTHPDFHWVTNYVESALSSNIWKSVNIATIAYEYRKLLDSYAEETCSDKSFVDYQAHDFSFRGVGGVHDSASHSIGHLFSFTGTDTILSIDFLEDYYDTGGDYIGGGVPATEHSVMSAGGKDTELETYTRLITELYPSGIISIVSDTWNYWNVLTNIAPTLKEQILSRQPNSSGFAKVVFRPDSGDPLKIICGDPEADPNSPAYLGSLELLWNTFGGSVNEKGFRELNPRIGLIYGDSITLARARSILETMRKQGWASSNILLGVGSYTYQYHTRDTLGIGFKTTWVDINGTGVEVMKDPVTDSGVKKSAKGLLRVEKDSQGNFYLLQSQTPEQEELGCLRTVFKDSVIYGRETNSLKNIKQRLLN